MAQPAQPGVPAGREEGLRVHAHGGRRVGPRQIDANQLHVLGRHLLARLPGPVAPHQEDRPGACRLLRNGGKVPRVFYEL